MDGMQRVFPIIVFVTTFCLICFFHVLPSEYEAGYPHPRKLYHNIHRVLVRNKTLHSQECPPLWRSYVESYRRVSYRERTSMANMESANYLKTTSPKYSTITILNEQPLYNLCDVLVIKIEARDGMNKTKTYGGDFFRFKIYDPSPYSATAEDDIIDFGNGTYLAFFTLRWTGKVRVEIKLVHPAELIPHLSLTLSGKIGRNINFVGKFISGQHSEDVICRFVEFPGATCNLSDPNTHGPWFCEKPKNVNLDCKHWRFHQMQQDFHRKMGYKPTPLSKSLLSKSQMVELKNNFSIEVIDKKPPRETSNPLPYCSLRGLPQGIHSSGHFFRNTWYHDHCKVFAFNLSDVLNCLSHKNVVILGDSTSRQIFEYFRDIYNGSFKQFPLPDAIEKYQGPLTLINTEYHANIKYHFHGLPITTSARLLRTDVLELVANRLNSTKDGCDVVYVICLWAHFVATGKTFYIQRLLAIKRAVQSFLERCPRSKVIIKGANTKQHYASEMAMVSSEWNIVQQELALRELFGDEKRVGFIDSLDITKVQPYEDHVHPSRQIVKEIVNRMLTYICKV